MWRKSYRYFDHVKMFDQELGLYIIYFFHNTNTTQEIRSVPWLPEEQVEVVIIVMGYEQIKDNQ